MPLCSMRENGACRFWVWFIAGRMSVVDGYAVVAAGGTAGIGEDAHQVADGVVPGVL